MRIGVVERAVRHIVGAALLHNLFRDDPIEALDGQSHASQ